MRSKFFGPGATLGGGTTYRSNATYAAAVLADSPVSYWRLGESSGTNAPDVQAVNAGTYTGGFTLSQASAIADGNKAVALNGTTGFVNVLDHATLRLVPPFTLECWVNPTDRAAFYGLINKTDGVTRSYEFYLVTGTGILELVVNGVVADSTSAVAIGAWSHVAVTVDGTTARFYINGAPAGTPALVSAGVTNTFALTIGSRTNAALFLKGSIDEAAVYGTVLSPARIAAHYAAA